MDNEESYSWEIIDTIKAIKNLDKSSFNYNGTGIPVEFRWFFNVSDFKDGDKKEISLRTRLKVYPARITQSNGRTRLFWEREFTKMLQDSFPDYYKSLLIDNNNPPRSPGKLTFIHSLEETDAFNVSLDTPVVAISGVLKLYENELLNPLTRFFIFDAKGYGDHKDTDYAQYQWSPSRFNQVKEGDLFLYRRPGKASEFKRFYFFGAGKIEKIIKVGADRVSGLVTKPLPFEVRILPEDLESFQWEFKKKGSGWEHFLNQYGMNCITISDFIGIVRKAFPNDSIESLEELDYELSLIRKLNSQNYFVEDHTASTKIRVGQKVFSDQVKTNYGYQCAITGIRTKEFLVGSHIIPWSVDKKHRLDPCNGICLSVLVDKAFDQGYITIVDNRVKLSMHLQQDPVIWNLLKPYENKLIMLPKHSPPSSEYLQWHYKHRFRN